METEENAINFEKLKDAPTSTTVCTSGILTVDDSDTNTLSTCGPIVAALAAAGAELCQCISSYRETELDAARIRQSDIMPNAVNLLSEIAKMKRSPYDLFRLPDSIPDPTDAERETYITPKDSAKLKRILKYYFKFASKCNRRHNKLGSAFWKKARIILFQYAGPAEDIDYHGPATTEKDGTQKKRQAYSVYISASILTDIFEKKANTILFSTCQSIPIEHKIAQHIISARVRPESTVDVILKLALTVDKATNHKDDTDTRVVLYVPDQIGCTVGSEIYRAMDSINATLDIAKDKITTLCKTDIDFATHYIEAVSTECIFQYTYSNPIYVPTLFDTQHKRRIVAAVNAMRMIARPPRPRKSLLPFV